MATRKWTDTSLVELVAHWAYAHHVMRRQTAGRAGVMVLRYEDVARDPAGQMGLITDRLGLPPLRDKPSFEDSNALYFAAWDGADEHERSFAEFSFGPIAAGFGYAFKPPYVLDDSIDLERQDVPVPWHSAA